MNKHFCRVGKIKPNLNKSTNLKVLENRISNFVEDTTKVDGTDDINATF